MEIAQTRSVKKAETHDCGVHRPDDGIAQKPLPGGLLIGNEDGDHQQQSADDGHQFDQIVAVDLPDKVGGGDDAECAGTHIGSGEENRFHNTNLGAFGAVTNGYGGLDNCYQAQEGCGTKLTDQQHIQADQQIHGDVGGEDLPFLFQKGQNNGADRGHKTQNLTDNVRHRIFPFPIGI